MPLSINANSRAETNHHQPAVAALKTFFDFLAEETDDLNWPNPVRFQTACWQTGSQLAA